MDDGGRLLFPGSTPPALRHLTAERMSGILSSAHDGATSVDLNGVLYVLRHQNFGYGLHALTVLRVDALAEKTRELAITMAVLTLTAIVGCSLLLFTFLRRVLLAPLQRLGEAAAEIGRGNVVTDLGIRRTDEIGQLADSFQEMSRSLANSHEEITHIAHHDALTGLPNRRMFMSLLERGITTAREKKATLGVLFLDLDDFKRVNDSFGHAAGDALLRQAAERLRSVIRPTDELSRAQFAEEIRTLARVGGDEFVVLLPGLDEAMQAGRVAERLIQIMMQPFDLPQGEFRVSASIGITTCPEDSDTPEALIRNADIAMYRAKELGKNAFCFYTAEMNTAVIKRVALERALRDAIKHDEFLLYYQPQIDARTGGIVGVEALLRWQSPDMGWVTPGEFIPVAEDTGLILELGEWVLHAACRQAVAWRDAGLRGVPVAVNVSSRQFQRTNLDEIVGAALADTGLDAAGLEIELTETSIMEDPDRAVGIMTALKGIGVHLSMDDFGTGYSSLSLLKTLPIDTLKIDQSFVRDIHTDRGSAAITRTIIAMGRSLNLRVIAEGVEEPSQRAFLQAEGCHLIQGFLFSRPLPPEQLEGFWHEDARYGQAAEV
jgi:diguanylate cyclase (GGDEF)-like protein